MTLRRRTAERRPAAAICTCVLALGLFGSSATAQSAGRIDREITAIEGAADELVRTSIEAEPRRSARWAEERLAEAEMYFRLGDHARAGLLLTDLVENHPEMAATPEALVMLGDALYASNELVGASQRYRQVLDRADRDPSYRRFAERALGRVVEIALRLRRFEGLEPYLNRATGDASSEATAATAYFRAKYYYGLAVPEEVAQAGRVGARSLDDAGVERARQLFASVPEGTTYAPQARYFVGVIHVLRQELGQAVTVFRAVAEGPAETPDHRRVRDLALLGIGRVQQALRQFPAALAAYEQVPRSSTLFPRALFETAWVHIALEDETAAARALEVMVLAAPESPLVPEAQLVRANLLLRSGRLREADVVFSEVGQTASPVLDDLQAVADRHDDLAAHFATLVREQRDSFSIDAFLPESARLWSEPDPQFERATATLEELLLVRRLIRETADLVERLELVLASSTIVNAFSDARAQAQSIEALRNRIELARASLVTLESRGAEAASPELVAARARRRALEAQLQGAPTTGDSIDERDGRRVQQIRQLARRLREVEVEVLGLEARITASEHFLESRPMTDPAGQASVLAELALHRAAVSTYRAQIVALRRELELLRMDVGVGDDVHRADAALREAYEAALTEERRLSGTIGGPSEASFQRLARVEARLDAREAEVLTIVRQRTARIRTVVAEERVNLDDYRARLAALEGDAEVVVGGISTETFRRVRRRFYDIVVRAEIGHVDVAWMDREQHRQMLEELTQTRAAELEDIDAEYGDILDTNTRRAPSEGESP